MNTWTGARRERMPLSLLLATTLLITGVLLFYVLPKSVTSKKPRPESPVVTAQAASPPEWYNAGWKAARAGSRSYAFSLWEKGLRALPGDRQIIVSNSYGTLHQFLPALKQYAQRFPSIGVRQRVGGQARYSVIVLPYGVDTRAALPQVRNLFHLARLTDAASIQKNLHENALPEASRIALKIPAAQKSSEENLVPTNPAAPQEIATPKADEWELRSATVREQLKADDYAQVSLSAQALADDFPERWEPWFWLGTAQLAQGRIDAAETALQRAGKLNPKVAQIWVQRAIVAQEHNDHTAAVKLLNEARELAPKSPQIFLNLGYSNDALGQTVEADKNYLRFLILTEGDNSFANQRKPILERMERKN